MLLGELSDVFRVAIADYYRFNIDQLIRRALTVLSWKGTPEAYAYPEEAYRIKAETELIVAEENELLRTGRAKTVFTANLFANLLPSDVARQIRSFMTVDIALSAPTTEAQFLLLRFQSSRTLMENFIQVSNSLGFYPFPLPRDRITLTLRLPQAIFGADLSRLGEVLQLVDAFFVEISEHTTGRRSKPVFQYASDTVLTLYLSIEPQQALPLMVYVKTSIDTAKSAIAFEGALGEMRRTQVSADTLDQMRRAHEATRDAALAQALDSAFERFGTLQAEADQGAMARLCIQMADLMERGLEIHLMRPLEPASSTLIPAEPLLGHSDIHRLVADTIVSQAELSTILGGKEVAVLQPRIADEPSRISA